MIDITRRAFLTAAGGTVAAAWLAGDVSRLLASGAHAERAGAAQPAAPFTYLTPAQAVDLDAASSQILPTDETPGAHEAHVVYFIDNALATWGQDQRPDFTTGLAELTKRAAAQSPPAASFAALTAAQQHAVIASLEKDKHPFFFALRGSTIVAVLANPSYGGNFEKTGWKLIGFEDRFSWAPPFGWYDADA